MLHKAVLQEMLTAALSLEKLNSSRSKAMKTPKKGEGGDGR